MNSKKQPNRFEKIIINLIYLNFFIMKTKFSILLTTGFFLTLVLTSCSKEEAFFSDIQNENIGAVENNMSVMSDNGNINSKDLIKYIKKTYKDAKITKNYTDHETGLVGTLCVYTNNSGEKQEVLFADENQNINTKGLIRSATINTNWEIHCDGGPHGRCIGGYNIFIYWNNEV